MHVDRDAMKTSSRRTPGSRAEGTAWIPACAGMTTTLRALYVDTLEYITHSGSGRYWATTSGMPDIGPPMAEDTVQGWLSW